MLTQERPHSLVANHELVREILSTYGPSSLAELRAEALARFTAAGLPTAKTEEFKYTPLTELRDREFLPAYGANVFRADLESTPIGAIEAVTLAFVNGEYAPELGIEGVLPEGVVFSTLRDALETHPEIVLEHLGKVHILDGKLGSTNDERFRWLNSAYLGEGAFLYVPRGVVLENLVHILFVNRADHGAFASHPRILIVLEENAQAKVLESHVGLSGSYFANCVTEMVVGKSANLEHIRYQSETDQAVHVGTVVATQEEHSVLSSNNSQFGARVGRVDLNCWVGGEHAETWLNGTYVADGDQLLDNHTRLDHAVPNCNSFEVYKGILGGNSVGVFNGKIFVYEDAQKTDAKQTNQAILLSPDAQINTKPQLEIFADDVKCTHGATVGQLQEEARFYLQSRGITKRQAEAILVYAFVAEVLDKISVESVRKALENALFAKLKTGGPSPLEE